MKKGEIHFVIRIFFHKCKLHENYFNIPKIYFMAIQNCGKSNRVLWIWTKVRHQIFGCWEVQTMWNLQKNMQSVRRNVFYFFKNVYKWACVEKTVHGVEIHWLSSKEKVRAQQSAMKVILIVFWNMKGPITTDFLEKDATVNSASLCQFLW